MTFDTNAADTGTETNNTADAAVAMPMSAKPIYWRLGDLFISEGNVRSNDDVRNIPELAAMIASQGLLNPLQISIELDLHGLPTGRGAVEAGGRRYRALILLVSQGKVTLDEMIECKQVPPGKAKEISLAENLGIQAMHPADEYAAYQSLVDEGKSLDAIANTYGVEVIHVKRRLKLANVAPELIALYRKGELTLDQMAAFASCDDQQRQINTWNGLSQWERKAHNIKRKLEEDEVPQDDPRVKVIGLQNYLAMGGTLKEDLFSENNDAALVDLGLVELMVGEALQAAVASVEAEGWAWVKSFGEFTYKERGLHEEVPRQHRIATANEAKVRKALEEQLQKLRDELEVLEEDDESDWEDCEKKEGEISAVEAQQAAFEETLVDFDSMDKSACGAVVAITDAGIEVFRGMVERTEKVYAGSSSGSGEPVKPPKPEFPESLMNNLTSHRTAAMQAAMLNNQSVGLAALANALALSLFSHYALVSPLKINLRGCDGDMERHSNTVAQSKAYEVLNAAKAAWEAVLPKDKQQWFAWFLEQPRETVLDFIVFASATSINSIKGTVAYDAPSAALSNALGLDMAQYWTAGPDTYFKLVPKAKLAAIVRETSTEEAAVELEKAKKDAAIQLAVKHTEGTNWLPLPLRVPVAPVAVESDLDSDPGDEGSDAE